MKNETKCKEIAEKDEITKETTKIVKMKMEDLTVIMIKRNVEQMDANDFNHHLGETPRTTDLHQDELDLLIAYRVMNELGKSALINMALDFARTPTMRNKCIRGI